MIMAICLGIAPVLGIAKVELSNAPMLNCHQIRFLRLQDFVDLMYVAIR
jgi:hypothetical protein